MYCLIHLFMAVIAIFFIQIPTRQALPVPTRNISSWVRRWLPEMIPHRQVPIATGPEAICAIAVRDTTANYCLTRFRERNFIDHFSTQVFNTTIRVLDANEPQLKEILPHLKQVCHRDAIQLMHYMTDSMARSAGEITWSVLLGFKSSRGVLDPDWPGTHPDHQQHSHLVARTPCLEARSSSTFGRLSNVGQLLLIKQQLRFSARSLTHVIAMTWHINHYREPFEPPTDCQTMACQILHQRLQERNAQLLEALEETIKPLAYAETDMIYQAAKDAVNTHIRHY
jgi:hypothetical protein